MADFMTVAHVGGGTTPVVQATAGPGTAKPALESQLNSFTAVLVANSSSRRPQKTREGVDGHWL
jgi:hypothetical protein